MSKPRVWVVPYLKGWSYDHTAQAIKRHLSRRFDIRIAYADDVQDGCLEQWPAEVVIDMWWHGTLHYSYGRRVLKQISSHRWTQEKWGSLSPARMLERYATGLGAIIVPSQRLFSLFAEVELKRMDAGREPRAIMIGPKGFEPDQFLEARRPIPRGTEAYPPLAVGWAGSSAAADKHVDVLRAAEPSVRLADGERCLTYGEMPAFYNALDVIAIASEAEGDPRPLIEGMACGCFPVTTDVGIVPELVRHLVTGYIVKDRTVEAFREAFEWCRRYRTTVRVAGGINADWMRDNRSWARVMPAWGDAIEVVRARGRDGVGELHGNGLLTGTHLR